MEELGFFRDGWNHLLPLRAGVSHHTVLVKAEWPPLFHWSLLRNPTGEPWLTVGWRLIFGPTATGRDGMVSRAMRHRLAPGGPGQWLEVIIGCHELVRSSDSDVHHLCSQNQGGLFVSQLISSSGRCLNPAPPYSSHLLLPWVSPKAVSLLIDMFCSNTFLVNYSLKLISKRKIYVEFFILLFWKDHLILNLMNHVT